MKILVVQPYGFGNSVMVTPMLKALHTLPKTEIYCSYDEHRWAAGAILKDIPFVKGIFGSRDVQIAKEAFDLIIACAYLSDLKEKYRIPRIMLPMPQRPQGTSQQAYQLCFKKHEVEYLMDAARQLGFVGDTPWPIIGQFDAVTFAEKAQRVTFGIGYYKGDAWSPRKHWGNEQFARLADDIAALGAEVYIVGGPRDRKDAAAIMKLANSHPRSMCGKFGLHQSFGLIKECTCFVGNDTGFAHAAAALQVPTMTIFKKGVSSTKKSAPRGVKAEFVVTEGKIAGYRKILDWVQKTLMEA